MECVNNALKMRYAAINDLSALSSIAASSFNAAKLQSYLRRDQ